MSTRSCTILVVDDDPPFLELIGSAFEAHGHRVIRAGDAETAEAILATAHVDLAIVDGALPKRDGITWIASVRAAGRNLPIVFCTARVQDLETATQLRRDLGVRLVAYKPVILDVFVDQVERHLPGAAPRPVAQPGPFELTIAKLRHEYLRGLGPKARELAELVARGVPRTRATADRDALDAARALAHRLRGTAGSYGFTAVSVAAGDVEDLLVAGVPDLESLERAVRRLTTAAAEPFGAHHRAADEGAPSSLLLVDDERGALDEFEEMLGARLEVGRCREPSRLLADIERLDPAVVVIAADLDVVSGFDLCRVVRASPRGPATRVILTGDLDDVRRSAAFHAGADDTVATPVEAVELNRQIDQHVDGAGELRRWRDRDPLTGLLRRGAFLHRARQQLAAGKLTNPTVAMIQIVDIVARDREAAYRLTDAAESELGHLVRSSFAAPAIAGRWRDGVVVVAVAGTPPESFRQQLAMIAATFQQFRAPESGWERPLSLDFASAQAVGVLDGIEETVRQAELQLL